MTTEPAPLDWTQENREGRGPSFIASVDGVAFGFVSDRGETYTPPEGGHRCRWKVWATEAGGECATVEDGRAAVDAEWARVNPEQEP